MTISYVLDTPVAGNNPSVDQPNLTDNTNAVYNILAVDHVTFNESSATPGGTHVKMAFADTTSFTALPTNIAGVAYPGEDSQDVMNMYFVNSTNFSSGVAYPLPMSIIKAGGIFSAGTSPSLTSSFNCTGISYNTGTGYSISLQSGVVQGTNEVMAFLSYKSAIATTTPLRYTYASNTLTVYPALGSSVSVAFVVLQF